MSRDLKEMKEQPCRYGGERIFQGEVRASAEAQGQVLIPLRRSKRLKVREPGEWVEGRGAPERLFPSFGALDACRHDFLGGTRRRSWTFNRKDGKVKC